MTERAISTPVMRKSFALHGWLGLGLIAIFWPLNWLLPGLRTAWAFFPLWLGYCLTVDALVFRKRGSSLFSRNWRRYVMLFLVSAPAWWIFEGLNLRIQNWHYLGAAEFSPLAYFLLATLNFSIVVPAIFGAAEWYAGTRFVQRLKPGWVIRPTSRTALTFALLGVAMFSLMMIWPRIFFPFCWLSLYFMMEPINIWMGNHALTDWLKEGDWRPVVSLFLGAVTTGFFWEMWNYFSYPKWVYSVPGVSFLHIFEMPLLGYGGYLPFALELYALYHLLCGLVGRKANDTVNLNSE